jgi:ribosomal protein S18 acetylase RimI-like enzyme
MTEEEFAAFKSWIIEDYARDIAYNYRLTLDEARANSTKEIDGMLSQGYATPKQLFYNIVLTVESLVNPIGYLWIDVDDQKKRCFIADIYLHEKYRGQGWGTKTLELLETAMQERGITRIGLHVFANNAIAQGLYKKMGYHLTGLNMQKWLTD